MDPTAGLTFLRTTQSLPLKRLETRKVDIVRRRENYPSELRICPTYFITKYAVIE
jgi:hypothetical protein